MIQLWILKSYLEHNLILERLQEGKERAEINGTKSGLPMNRPRIELNNEDLVASYRSGASVTSIAKKYKVSRGTIYNRLEELGLK